MFEPQRATCLRTVSNLASPSDRAAAARVKKSRGTQPVTAKNVHSRTSLRLGLRLVAESPLTGVTHTQH